LLRADEVEAPGDEGGEFSLPRTEVAEEAPDGGVDVGQRRVVDVAECLLLEEPPLPFDQVQVWRLEPFPIWRKRLRVSLRASSPDQVSPPDRDLR
jgi:hypothetical protein